MSVLFLVIGALAGAACAALALRRSRERMHEELKAISVDVLAQTG
jgi:hypothetical protein